MKNNRFYTPSLFALFIVSLCYFPPSLANNISLSYGTYQDTLTLGENNIELDPSGTTIYTLFEATPEFSFSFNYGEFDDNAKIANASVLKLDATSWGAGVSYNWQAWLFSLDYGYAEEDININNTAREIKLYQEHYQAPSWSVSGAYGDFISEGDSLWYWSLSGNVQYTDWERNTERSLLSEPQLNTGKDAGDSWFSSLGLSLSQFYPTAFDSGFIYGGSLSWHHLITGESGIVSRNGRSISQISTASSSLNARLSSSLNNSNFSQKIDGEHYGLASLFIGYDANEKFSVELNVSTSLAADTNAKSANISASYQF